ncbi:LlaJI family restriction endonuclease [Qipengyuania sp. R86523]|uniref:LlaJI family restriction endonuclease n=1 Tax=Qipengyuania sp. R86523 TaxID=3093862 RepID=UPI0037C67951
MSLTRLIEGQRRTAQAWRDELGLNLAAWDGLVAEGVFAPARNGRSSEVILQFVGLIGLPDRLLACMPRVEVTSTDPVLWLRRVLSTYFVRETRRSRDDATVDLQNRDKSLFREIDALATLLGFFSERGLHQRSTTSSNHRGSGAVDWSSTLTRCEPLIANGQPIYVEPRRWLRTTETNEISRLQAAATVWLAHKYEVPVPPGLIEATAGMDVQDRMASERAAFDLALLARERSVTYLSSDLRLLDALEAVISNSRDMSGVAAVKLFGTTAFALVWEDALRDLFGDDASLSSLGQANWYDVHDGALAPPRQAASRRLDLMIHHKGEILLLDAKYHYPFPDTRPGWADIIKQIYYAELLVKDAHAPVRNAFLLPKAGKHLKLASLVRIEGAAREFAPIEAWTLDPSWVFSAYGDGDMARRSSACDAFMTARDEVAKVLGDA